MGLGHPRALGPRATPPDLTPGSREEIPESVTVGSNLKMPFRDNVMNSGNWRLGLIKCNLKTWQGFNEATGHDRNHPSTGGKGGLVVQTMIWNFRRKCTKVETGPKAQDKQNSKKSEKPKYDMRCN